MNMAGVIEHMVGQIEIKLTVEKVTETNSNFG
jgi:hypothetical protein